jgi:hypothetical protein
MYSSLKADKRCMSRKHHANSRTVGNDVGWASDGGKPRVRGVRAVVGLVRE